MSFSSRNQDKVAVSIDGKFLDMEKTGVSRFACEILCNIPEEVLDDVVVEVFATKLKKNNLARFINFKEIGFGKGFFWEQFVLPFYLKGKVVFLSGSFSVLLLLKKNCDIYYVLHSVAFLNIPENYSRLFRFYYKLILPFIIKRSRKIYTVSYTEKKRIVERFPACKDKISIIYNAPSKSFYPKSDFSRHENYLLYVGSLTKYKGFDSVVKAYKAIRQKYSFLSLKVVGDLKGSVFSNNEVEIPDGVEVLGQIDDVDRMRSLYQNATVLVFLSKYESYGLPVIEALASGCPVICSKEDSLMEVAGTSVVSVDYYNVDLICKEIGKLVEDQSYRLNLISKGIEKAGDYSWCRSSKELFESVSSG